MHNMKRNRWGFSLPEMLATMTLVALMGVSVHQFSISSMIGLLNSQLMMDANQDVRDYFSGIKSDVNHAHYIVLYDAFDGSFRNVEEGISTNQYRLGNEQKGNFMLFVYNGEDPNLVDNVPAPVEKMVGYYLDDRVAGNFKVRRFAVDVPTNTAATVSIESLLPLATDEVMDDHPVLFSAVSGALDGSMFYKLSNYAYMLSLTAVVGEGKYAYSHTYSSTMNGLGI